MAACQLCAAFDDVGVGVCTSFADELECDVDNGNPSTASHDDDDDDDGIIRRNPKA